MDSTVSDNSERSRFEIHHGDRLAGVLQYRLDGAEITFVHTEIADEFGGQGLAGMLVRGAADSARNRALTVVPECEFARSWLGRHRDYADILTPERGRVPPAP